MPTYEYRCNECETIFAVVMHMSEHDRKRVKCPKCKSASVTQQYSTFYTKTSRKS